MRFIGFGLFLFALALPLRAEDTTITGGRMELLDKGERVIFKGGVTLERGGDVLKAREMTTNKRRDKVVAVGDVQLFRRVSSTETFRAFGDRGRYDTNLGQGQLEGKSKPAHLVHTVVASTAGARIVHIYASTIDFSNKDQKAVARGAVRGSTTDPETKEEYKFWSETAEWEGQQRKVTLSGTPLPLVKQTAGTESKTITGQRIVYFIDGKQVISEGSAKAVFLDSKGQPYP